MANTSVLALVGSLRKDSFNKKLLQVGIQEAPEGMEITTFDIGTLPLFSQDLEAELPDSVKELYESIRRVDAILFVTPEYNYGVPGVLKNAIDWASRPPRQSPIYGKPAAIFGGSPGMVGTGRAQLHLRQYFGFLNMPAVIQPEVLVSQVHTKFDDQGNFTDEKGRELIGQLLENLVTLVDLYRD
jgi:chromate reductase